MGASLPELALGAASTVFGISSSESQQQAANQRVQQLKMQQQQAAIQAEQQAQQRALEIQRVIGTQTVQGASRGIAAASPSFAEIGLNSAQNFVDAQRLAKQQAQAVQAGFSQQEKAVQDQAKNQQFLSFLGIGKDILGFGTDITKAFGGEQSNLLGSKVENPSFSQQLQNQQFAEFKFGDN